MDEQEGVFEGDFHALGVGNEIGRDVAPVKLHAFDDIKRRGHRFRLFNGDNPILAHLLHCFGDQISDGGIIVGGNRSDLGDLLLGLARLAELLELLNDGLDRLVDPPFDIHGVRAGGNVFDAFAEDRLGQNGRSRRSIACHVARLRGAVCIEQVAFATNCPLEWAIGLSPL